MICVSCHRHSLNRPSLMSFQHLRGFYCLIRWYHVSRPSGKYVFCGRLNAIVGRPAAHPSANIFISLLSRRILGEGFAVSTCFVTFTYSASTSSSSASYLRATGSLTSLKYRRTLRPGSPQTSFSGLLSATEDFWQYYRLLIWTPFLT